MKVSEWLAVAGLVVSVALAGVAGWTQISARISSVEQHLSGKQRVINVMRETVIQNTKALHELKGMHTEHKHTGAVIGHDEPVMAEAYLNESEM